MALPRGFPQVRANHLRAGIANPIGASPAEPPAFVSKETSIFRRVVAPDGDGFDQISRPVEQTECTGLNGEKLRNMFRDHGAGYVHIDASLEGISAYVEQRGFAIVAFECFDRVF